MSKTDNTRPWRLQGADLTKSGYIQHHHIRRHNDWLADGTMIAWAELLPCDYRPSNNLANYHAGHVTNNRQHPLDSYRNCERFTYACGGWRHRGGATKQARRQRRRQLRARERRALQQARWSEDYEFDLKPVREDAQTIQDDLG